MAVEESLHRPCLVVCSLRIEAWSPGVYHHDSWRTPWFSSRPLSCSAALGAQFGVNSIKAVGNGDLTYNIVSLPGLTNIYVGVPVDGTEVSGVTYVTENGAVNAMNALFTVTPLAGGGDYVPVFPISDAVEVVGYNQAEVKASITEKEPGVPHLRALGVRPKWRHCYMKKN